MTVLSSPKAKTSTETTRSLRADAQRNYDVLVAAANAEFTARGADVSLEDIARRAKVGIGTLYRHFPTRDDLLAKVLNDSTAVIVARGRELLQGPSPGANLMQWLRELVDYTATYRGLSVALANGFVGETGTRLCSNCDVITAAGAALLARAQAAGEIRPDAQVVELILSAQSAAWIAEQIRDRGAGERLLGILFDGLRVTRDRAPSRRRRRKR
ncbi:MAG TPA: helix-turn-helix domain-containing protein [Polyangia bacterium]|nr:helix-turn-helix domain-containing protein [Polyangia bacterium]